MGRLAVQTTTRFSLCSSNQTSEAVCFVPYRWHCLISQPLMNARERCPRSSVSRLATTHTRRGCRNE